MTIEIDDIPSNDNAALATAYQTRLDANCTLVDSFLENSSIKLIWSVPD